MQGVSLLPLVTVTPRIMFAPVAHDLAAGPDVTNPVITSLTAGSGNAQVTVTWATVDNVAVTAVALTENGRSVYSGSAASGSATDAGRTNGVALTYTLTVSDAAGNVATQTVTVTPVAPVSSTTEFTEDWNRANTSAGWQRGWTVVSGGADTSKVSSNQGGMTPPGSSVTKVIIATLGVLNADQWCESDMPAIVAGASHPALILRCPNSGSVAQGYAVGFTASGWVINRIDNGVPTALKTVAGSVAAGYRYRLEAQGTVLRLYAKAAADSSLSLITSYDSASDSTSYASGPGAGYRWYITSNASQEPFRVDNFACGNL